jgi:hypothetical protein
MINFVIVIHTLFAISIIYGCFSNTMIIDMFKLRQLNTSLFCIHLILLDRLFYYLELSIIYNIDKFKIN